MKTLITAFCVCIISTSFGQTDFETQETNPVRKADQFIESYQFDKALQVLNDPADSSNLNVLSRRGHCFFRLGNYGAAIAQYRRILKIDSTHRNALFQLAQLYGRNNQFENAEKCFVSLLRADSTNSFYHKQYGVAANQAGNLVTAFLEFKNAVEFNNRDVEAYILLSNTMLEMELYPALDSMLTQTLTRIKSPQLKLLLAKTQLEEEKYEACIETTSALMTTDTIPQYARLIGISKFETNKYEESIPWMHFLLRNGVNAEWVHYYLGVAFLEMQQTDSAIFHLNQAIDKGISENIHSYYSQLAKSYEAKKDFKNAIKYYKAAYESSKTDVLLFHIARSYDVFFKDKTQAIAYYKRYLNSDDTIKSTREYARFRLDQLDVLR